MKLRKPRSRKINMLSDVRPYSCAHIVGVGRQGPRSKAAPLSDDIDAVENLLLLCGEHHRIVDNSPRIYSVEVLAKYKADHEAKMAPRKLRPERRWGRSVPAVAEPPVRYWEVAGGRQP